MSIRYKCSITFMKGLYGRVEIIQCKNYKILLEGDGYCTIVDKSKKITLDTGFLDDYYDWESIKETMKNELRIQI